MKKLGYLVLVGVAITFLFRVLADFVSSDHQAAALGIIGGADGPTSVFVATKINPSTNYWYLLGILLVIAFIWNRKR